MGCRRPKAENMVRGTVIKPIFGVNKIDIWLCEDKESFPVLYLSEVLIEGKN